HRKLVRSPEVLSQREFLSWLGSFLDAVWNFAAARCSVRAGLGRRDSRTKDGAARRWLSIFNVAAPMVSISVEPRSRLEWNGRVIFSAATGRRGCTSEIMQTPSSGGRCTGPSP